MYGVRKATVNLVKLTHTHLNFCKNVHFLIQLSGDWYGSGIIWNSVSVGFFWFLLSTDSYGFKVSLGREGESFVWGPRQFFLGKEKGFLIPNSLQSFLSFPITDRELLHGKGCLSHREIPGAKIPPLSNTPASLSSPWLCQTFNLKVFRI